jgi:hypothetical protein
MGRFPQVTMAFPQTERISPCVIDEATAPRRKGPSAGRREIVDPENWAGSPCGWFAVSERGSIIGLFARRDDAHRFAMAG